jgi:hypothetical protein
MPFILLIGLFLPRLVTVFLYFFTHWFTGIFETWYWPLLGFIFMPYTLLWYSAVTNWYGHWGFWQIGILVIAILMDLSSNGSASRGQSNN